MRTRGFLALVGGVVLSTAIVAAAAAETFMCPQPQEVRCVPAAPQIDGWRTNGGQMTGNSFMPNSECANVIPLGPTSQRLLCCYVKCGVFIREVKAAACTKVSESQFDCQ